MRFGGRRYVAPAAVVVAALLGLAVAGCGGDDGNATTAGEATTAAQGGGGGGTSTLAVSETDYKLDPSDPTIKAGQVMFDVSNDGQVVHNLEVEGPNGEQELNSDLSPGQTGTMTVDLSKPGKYEFYCPVGNHKELGMEGEITVQ